MRRFPEFPASAKALRKYDGGNLRIQHGDPIPIGDRMTVTGVAALAQQFEHELLNLSAPDVDAVGDIVTNLIVSGDLADFFETIFSVAVDGQDIEIEFSAFGYPGRYMKRICLDGPSMKYPHVEFLADDELLRLVKPLRWDSIDIRRVIDEVAESKRLGDVIWVEDLPRVQVTSPLGRISGFSGYKIVVPGPFGVESTAHARVLLHDTLLAGLVRT